MAKRKRKPLRDLTARIARVVKAVLTMKSFMQNPVGKGAEMIIDKATRLDNHRKLKGAYRNRVQYLNPRIKRWVVKDMKTGRFVRVKRDSKPFKNIRKALRKSC